MDDHLGYIKFLTQLLNSIANHYVAAGWLVSELNFQWKLLTPNDSILKLRTMTQQQREVIETKNFNKIANQIPFTNDWTQIEGAILTKAKWKDTQYLSNIWLKNVLGQDTVQTTWSLNSILVNGAKVTNVEIALLTGQIIAKFTDVSFMNEKGIPMIERTFMDGSKFIFEDKDLIIKSTENKDAVFMKDAQMYSWDDVNQNKLFTYDIETRENFIYDSNNKIVLDKDNQPVRKLSIVSIALYHKDLLHFNDINAKDQYWTWFITDFNSEKDMITDFFSFIRSLTIEYGKDMHLMAHNSSNFDMIFMLKYLVELVGDKEDINFLLRDKKFISILWAFDSKEFYYEKGVKRFKQIRIRFMDSFLMLPMSLAKAAKQFQVENKGSFDFNLINQTVDKEFLDNIKSRALLNLHRNEIINYNVQDCRVLWHVMANFAKNTVDKFSVNILKQPTAASIAFATFRTMFLKDEHKIAISSKHIYDMISPAYMGGACDVYKPQNPQGSMVYTYDINSEYPAMMATKLMPTGHYQHVIGPIDISNPDLIAFVKAKITVPEDIKVPLLPMNVNGKMVTGAGTFEGMYYSKELNYALSLGYKIEAYEAYIFEGRLVFDEFITTLYKERLSYPKSNPMNYICKLIMNSTYGRFGMAPILTDVKLLGPNDLHKYEPNTKFLDITNINEDLVMVTSNVDANTQLHEKANKNLQISIPIAAAITSEARICIHQYKQAAAEAGTLLYSDTDSIMTSAPLSDDLLGTELGKLKLEYTAQNGIFLSAKVYALEGVEINGVPSDDIIKAKGIKKGSDLSFNDFKVLLNKENVYRSFQEKWFRSISQGEIKIQQLSSMVRINEGKRVVVTNLENKFIDTWNIIFENNKVVSPSVVKIGLPVVYNSEDHLDLEGFRAATQFYLEEGAKDPVFIKKAQEKLEKSRIRELQESAAAEARAKEIESRILLEGLRTENTAVFTKDQLHEIFMNRELTITGIKHKITSLKLILAARTKFNEIMDQELQAEQQAQTAFLSQFTFLNENYTTPLQIAAPAVHPQITAPSDEETEAIILPAKLRAIPSSQEAILLPSPRQEKVRWLPKAEWIAQQKRLGLFKPRPPSFKRDYSTQIEYKRREKTKPEKSKR